MSHLARSSFAILGPALFAAAAVAAGCRSAPGPIRASATIAAPAPRAARVPAQPPAACALHRPARIAPAGEVHQSSTVALARSGDRTLAFVADEDDAAVHTFDVDARRTLAVTPLDAAPAQLLVLGDGRIAVTLRGSNRVALFEPGARDEDALVELCTREIAAEPFAMARDAAGGSLAVTSVTGHALTVLELADLHPRLSVDLPRDPRGVVTDASFQRAFVAHSVGGRVSVVDLAPRQGEGEARYAAPRARAIDVRLGKRGRDRIGELDEVPRDAGQGFALAMGEIASSQVRSAGSMRVFAPQASVHPGRPGASAGYGAAPGWGEPPAVAPAVAVIDSLAERPLTRALRPGPFEHGSECLLPRAAAVEGETLYVACMGIDAVLELDARALDPIQVERRRHRVPVGPTGVAVDGARRRLVTFSQIARALAVIDLGGSAATVVVPAATRASQWTSGPVARGRELFHATDDLRISADGRACASCHPDGRDDGLTWSTPDGPRQTPSLAGRVTGTAPYGWFGSSGTVRGHLEHTFGRLQGRGFARTEDAADLAALVAYLGAMRAPARDAVPQASPRAELVAAGRALFFDARQGCASCHDGGGSDAARHDVGSGNVDERSLRFDTPSLIGIGGSAPYFHDGRYATLEDMLATSDERMGHTLHLSRADMRALVAFMGTL